jgi:hypothetical protein
VPFYTLTARPVSGVQLSEFRVFKPDDVPSVEQIKSTWNYKHDRMEGIKVTVLEGLTLPEELAEVLKNEK